MPEQLYRPADLSTLPFNTTDDIEVADGTTIGQPRAFRAIGFGASIDKPGFNIVAVGRPQARMREAAGAVLAQAAAVRPTPSDWVYVNNFADPRRPVAIALPAGRAVLFRDAMSHLIDDVKTTLPAVFVSEEYQNQRSGIEEALRADQQKAIGALQEKASEQQIAVVRTPIGFALVPAIGDKVVSPEEFHKWPEERRREYQEKIQSLEKDFEHLMREIPQWERRRRDAIRDLNRKTAESAVAHLIEEVKAQFSDIARISEHLDRVRTDLVDSVSTFIGSDSEEENELAEDAVAGGRFDRYQVNVLISQDGRAGAPVIEEPHPTLGKLMGAIEYSSRQGVLVTNFRLIKAGAIHRANGGYLVIDLRNLLSEPFSWPALKRVLRRREIAIEDVSRLIGLTSTVSLEPEPIPLDVRVVLLGDRLLYFLLAALDPEFEEHFKVLADFDDDIDRSPDSEALFGRLIAAMVKGSRLRPMDRSAVGRLIEHAARLAGNSGKLTLLIEQVHDLLIEADFLAARAEHRIISGADIDSAIAERIHRASRIRDRTQEAILDRVALIETAGARVGQINGLSVIEVSASMFGYPTRISCRARPGTGRLVDIEREVDLGGPIHSKGVLILAGFLTGRYALDTPMSLHASLVFEQSYGGVEGDSASSAELCALLSELADVPLRQDLAITGSVNQHGEMQAIGAVNEKIEGFFDVCQARGLTGSQGVIVPQSNLRHLMLRRDVIEACANGRFAVYAVASIDDAMALMTNLGAGVRGPDGEYPIGSVNRRVEDRLRAFAERRREFAGRPRHETGE